MTLEDLVALYLERREGEGLAPKTFCAELAADVVEAAGGRAELARAIDRTLEAMSLFEPLPRDLVPSASPDSPRRQLGEWELLREIGRGGMGIVFEARRTGQPDDPLVALKLLPLAGLLGARALERFEREASVLARLDDERIVAARGFGVDGDTPYLVMDLVPGTPLQDLAGHMSVAEAARLVSELARAVHSAHERGVLHRDIKPGNVIVRPDGTPVLLDFGLTASDADESLTSTGDLLGTPRYMSPEQARGQTASEASDVWSLGAVLYELVHGKAAFPQDSRSDVLAAVCDGRWARAGHVQADEAPSPSLDRVLRTAMAWRPSRRYPSAAAMADDLQRLSRGAQVLARPPGPVARIVDATARRPLRATVFGTLSLLAIVVALFVLRPWWIERATAQEARLQRLLDHAVAHWVRERTAPAAALVTHILGIEPRHAPARLMRADLSGDPLPDPTNEGLHDLAEALAAHERGDLLAAQAFLQAAVLADPDSAWIRVALADNAAARDQWHEAEAALVEASQRLPDSKAVAQELSRVYRVRRKLVDAEREARRALQLDRTDPHLWQALAHCLFLLRSNEADAEALEAARQADRLFESFDRSNANLQAALLDRMGRHGEAQVVFRQLIEAHPDETGYIYNLAFSLVSEERDAEAKPLYEQIRAREPTNLPATLGLAWLLTTTAADELRDVDAAGTLLLDALARDRGRSTQLVAMIEEFAQRTGRSQQLADLLGTLVDAGEMDARRVRLAKARGIVQAALLPGE